MCCQETPDKKVIYLLSLLPYYNTDPSISPSFDHGQNIQPALELAQDQINNSSTLLENYTLKLVFAQDGCNIASVTSLSYVMEAFSGRGRFTGIVGPTCSASTIELSSLTNRTQLNLVTVHDAGSPNLADRTRYPFMLGTLGSADGFAQAMVNLLKMARWKRMAVLYDDSRVFYQDTKRNLLTEIQQLNGTQVELLSPVSPTFIPLAAFEQSHLRIAFVLCPAALSRKIICLSFNRSFIYRAYQWVFMGHQLEDLLQPIEFVFDGIHYNCSMSDMATALEMSLLLTYSLKTANESMQLVVSNISYEEYLHYYTEYRQKYNREDIRASARNSTYTFWAANVYDTVWAWALVLDNLTKTQESFEVGSDYGNLQLSEMIVEQFYRTRFQGVSGEISFDRDTGYTNRAVDITQVRNATPHSDQGQESTEFIFIQDSFPSTVRENSVLTSITASVIIIQISVVAALHILTAIYRKRPSIKASSPKLLHISYIGAYMVGLGSFLYFLFLAAYFPIKVRPYFCQLLWGWCLPIGFILTMVPVAMRTWRIYRIFKHYLNPGPFISNPILIGCVVVLLFPVLVVSTTWNVIDPFRVEKIFGERISTTGVQVKEECNCTYHYMWLALILAYSTAILLLLSIFSLLTRNIENRSFATTALRVLAYIMTASFLFGFPLFYLLNVVSFNSNYATAVFAIHINFMMTAFIACVFMPPVLPLLRSLRKRVRKISTVSVTSATVLMHPNALN